MQIRRLINNLFLSNTYLVINEYNEALIIDPGSSYDELIETIERLDTSPKAIIATHGHIDHIVGVSKIKEKYKIPFYLHSEDATILSISKPVLSRLGLQSSEIETPLPDNYIEENIYEKFNFKYRILHTPGHTAGSICILIKDKLFTGDTIFNLSIGRTDYGGDINMLVDSIHNKIFKLPNDTSIYPGHGEPTTVEYEIKHNPFVGIKGEYPFKY